MSWPKSDKPKIINPWTKPALLALSKGKSLHFKAPAKRMRAIRKAASVAGSENEKVFSVTQDGDKFTITRRS